MYFIVKLVIPHPTIHFTVGENIIGTLKIRNDYGAAQLFTFAILNYLLIVLFYCFLFGISSLLIFLDSPLKVIAIQLLQYQ